ncbi:MAG: hypothetical protein JWN17_3085 [Frankiales bacterium]|nr:hypothetical protein [Frankiales bacterium]
MRNYAALGLTACLALTACGTTVPVGQTLSVQQGGTAAGTSGSGLDGAPGPDEAGGGVNSVGSAPSGSGGAAATGKSAGSSVNAPGTGGSGSTSSGAADASSTRAGGAGGSGGTGGSGAPTGPVAPGARVTTPIKVGVVTTDIGAAVAALGGSARSTTAEQGYRAIFKAVNAEGGLAGRQIVPTFYKVDATSTAYAPEAARACSTFVDAHDEVVLSESASTAYGFAGCLTKQGIPVISSNASDSVGYAQTPALFGAFAPSFDRGYGAVVDKLVASGYVTSKSKIGTIRITCPEVDRAYKNTVLSRMRAAGLATPFEYTVNCASGFNDAGSYSAAMQSAVLKFASAGVDRVFILGDQELILLSYFAQQAQSQNYRPGYALSSGSLPYTLIGASTFPQQQLPLVHGVGWHPQGDTGADPKSASEKRCASLATKGGVQPKSVPLRFLIYQNCSNVLLLEAALKRGNGTATPATLQATIPTLGSSFPSTGIIGGQTLFGRGRQDGPQLASEWSYVTSCKCLRYLGKPSPMR